MMFLILRGLPEHVSENNKLFAFSPAFMFWQKKKRIREVRIINLKAGRGFPSGSWVKSPPVMQET